MTSKNKTDEIVEKIIPDAPKLGGNIWVESHRRSLKDAIESGFLVPRWTENELYQILARAYCTERNQQKTLDPDLVVDMARCILADLTAGDE